MLIKQKNSPYFYAVFYCNKKQQWISLGTSCKKEAFKLYGELRRKHMKHKFIMRLKKVLGNDYITENKSDIFIKDIEEKHIELKEIPEDSHKKLKIFLLWLKNTYPELIYVSQIKPDIAIEFLSDRYNSLAPKTFNNVKSALFSVFKVLEFYKLENPFKGIPSKQKDSTPYRAFTDDEVKSIIKHAKGYWRDFVLISLYTGLRLKDIVYLRPEQVLNDYLELVPSKTIRYKRAVRIYIHPAIKHIFKNLSSEYLYPNAVRQYGYGSFNKYFRELLQSLHIKDTSDGKASFHSLRVTFVTNCSRSGIDLKTIGGIVGHVSEQQTEHYNEDYERGKMILRLPNFY